MGNLSHFEINQDKAFQNVVVEHQVNVEILTIQSEPLLPGLEGLVFNTLYKIFIKENLDPISEIQENYFCLLFVCLTGSSSQFLCKAVFLISHRLQNHLQDEDAILNGEQAVAAHAFGQVADALCSVAVTVFVGNGKTV